MKTALQNQHNTYKVLDSMGRFIMYLTASNINEACQLASEKRKEGKIATSYYKVKRAYSGGVRG